MRRLHQRLEALPEWQKIMGLTIIALALVSFGIVAMAGGGGNGYDRARYEQGYNYAVDNELWQDGFDSGLQTCADHFDVLYPPYDSPPISMYFAYVDGCKAGLRPPG